jgi:hypothetical protein
MKAVLISFNWKTEEVMHSPCKDELEAFGLLASIRDDFPKEKGWSHHVINRKMDDLNWLVKEGGI